MQELRHSILSPAIRVAYRLSQLRQICLKLLQGLEGGDMYSATLRDILETHCGVRAGAYSYGEGLIPGTFPPGVTIGRYVSIAAGVRVFLRNHPLDRLSMHPFFYNKRLHFLRDDSIVSGTLQIGHDAWVGERAIITPGCSRIGIGAVVGAGAVVTKDIPDFAVVAGNPARLIRYRFPKQTRELILASRWWERPVEECAEFMSEMTEPLGDDPWRHPLLRWAIRSVAAEAVGEPSR
jgi:virginiamycin A acetyltransferase